MILTLILTLILTISYSYLCPSLPLTLALNPKPNFNPNPLLLTLILALNLTLFCRTIKLFFSFEFGLENDKIAWRFKKPFDYREVPPAETLRYPQRYYCNLQ